MSLGVSQAPVGQFEDHREAYFFWEKLGFSSLCCLHVDAHLDISDFPLPGYAGDVQGASSINCGNYLYHAIRAGMVGRVIWLAPPWLLGPVADRVQWARNELQSWVRLTLDDYQSLRLEDGRVEGTLCGVPFTICDTEHLPPLGSTPILLDIDVDYHVAAGDEIWQSPLELAQALRGCGEPVAFTIALSVLGGYTPAHLRHLGELTRLSQLEPDQYEERLQQGPPWWRAAQLVRDGPPPGDPLWEQAARLDPELRSKPFDRAAYHFQRRQFEDCSGWLDRLTDPLDMQSSTYMRAFVAYMQADDATALLEWTSLLPGLEEPVARAHLLEMCAKSHMRARDYTLARDRLEEALLCLPDNAQLWRESARAWENLGADEQAAERYRRSVELSPAELLTQPARYQLAKVYQRLGMVPQATAELRGLLAVCPQGTLTARARLLLARLSIRS